MKLPHGAAVVDFAYTVHTDVGNTCIAAKVDRQLVPLRTQLKNGQTVEIITADGAHPSPAWLGFVVSAKARSNIRHYQKSMKREEAIELGRRMLDRALAVFDVSADAIPPDWESLDVGSKSIETFRSVLENARTVIWNGPMGVFEIAETARGTYAIAELLSEVTAKGAITVIGGGDSASAVNKAGVADKVSHVSTGGGASLEFIEGKTLPGVAALTDK